MVQVHQEACDNYTSTLRGVDNLRPSLTYQLSGATFNHIMLMVKTNNSAKYLIGTIIALLFAVSNIALAGAASTATVAATVTVQNISVTVADGSVAYGTQGTSATVDTTSGGLDDSQTATNNGNITEDLNIKGQNSANWTLVATAGADQYFHKFCTSNCDSSPTWTAMTTSYQQLANAVSGSGTSVFDTQLGTPTSSTNFTQQSVDVTVQAVAD